MQPAICTIAREVDIYLAARHAREYAQRMGFGANDRTRIEIAILELTRNILAHAGHGQMLIEPVDVEGKLGMAIEARDAGPGIADIELALRDGFSTAQTMGTGLPSVRRLMDTFSIESQAGVGTRVRAVKWLGRTSARG
jgi:anti-sigma regulatory factor (Ser/Thr protein kinase)